MLSCPDKRGVIGAMRHLETPLVQPRRDTARLQRPESPCLEALVEEALQGAEKTFGCLEEVASILPPCPTPRGQRGEEQNLIC